jgi:hypothetical protein
VVGVHRREVVDPRVHQKGFGAEHAAARQRPEVGGVGRHHTAPKPAVDVQQRCAGGELDRQRLGGGGHWNAVERHVDDGGDPARSGGSGGAGEALPLGAAGLVDVHVGVDQPGHQHPVAEVGCAGRPAGFERHNFTAFDAHCRRDQAAVEEGFLGKQFSDHSAP